MDKWTEKQAKETRHFLTQLQHDKSLKGIADLHDNNIYIKIEDNILYITKVYELAGGVNFTRVATVNIEKYLEETLTND